MSEHENPTAEPQKTEADTKGANGPDPAAETTPASPDLGQARDAWLVGERKLKMKIVLTILGGLVVLGVATLIWYHFVRMDRLPVACEAAIQKLQTVCKIDRREAIKRIKNRPALVAKDPTRRETCRVLATPDHEFWRQRAIRELLRRRQQEAAERGRPAPGQRSGRSTSGSQPETHPITGSGRDRSDRDRFSEQALPQRDDAAAGKGQEGGKRDGKPGLPPEISASGPLSDVARFFVIKEVMPTFIQARYCTAHGANDTDDSQALKPASR
jgi:hypothetical protein